MTGLIERMKAKGAELLALQHEQHILETHFQTYVWRYGIKDWFVDRQERNWNVSYLAHDDID